MNDPTNNLIVLMVFVPMVMGLLCVPLINRLKLCRTITAASFLTTFVMALVFLNSASDSNGIHVSQMGHWAAPYGITLVFDSLSGLMLAAASLVALATSIHAFGSLSVTTERRYFHPLVNFMMAGVNLSFLTGDLFNLFVAFEIMLMASYGLLVIGGGQAQLRQAYKYVVMNLLASSVFVIAAGMAYGMFGTLNMADLARITAELSAKDELPAGFAALGVLFLFVFALKAGVFPLWFWLPDTYPTCPISIAALFGGVLTKVGLYAIARTFSLIFVKDQSYDVLVPILMSGAAMTMLVAVFGALAYTGLRRVLSLILIVGVGYSLLGIAVMSDGSIAGAVFYMTQSMLVMAGLFLCCGLIERATGTDETGRMGALLQTPRLLWVGVMLLVGLIGVVGLPPTSGFHGKLLVVRETLAAEMWWAGGTALLVGGLTLLAALRVWGSTFWGPTPEGSTAAQQINAERKGASTSETLGTVVLVAASLVMGFVAQPVLGKAATAGSQLVDPSSYIESVLDNPRYDKPVKSKGYDKSYSDHDGHDHAEQTQDGPAPHAAEPATHTIDEASGGYGQIRTSTPGDQAPESHETAGHAHD